VTFKNIKHLRHIDWFSRAFMKVRRHTGEDCVAHGRGASPFGTISVRFRKSSLISLYEERTTPRRCFFNAR